MTRIRQIDTDFLTAINLHAKVNQRLSAKSASSALNPLREIYRREIGVREATGRNDGPRVSEYLRYCGLGEGYEWCAAFVSWCHGQAGYAEPRNAWAAALFPSGRTVWDAGGRLSVMGGGIPVRGGEGAEDSNRRPRSGDVFGIYVAAKKRIAHCGFVDGWDGTWCITVEGNVNHSVVRKRRPVRTIYAVARWVGK